MRASSMAFLLSASTTIAGTSVSSAIRAARRAGVPIKKRHTVLQLLFVLDTVDALWLYFRLRGAAKTDFTKEENAQ